MKPKKRSFREISNKSDEIVERINDPTGRKSSHGGGHRRRFSAKDGRT